MIYLYIGIAGAKGAVLRYFAGMIIASNSVFPWATLVVNLSGSFILAWLTASVFQRFHVSPVLASAIGTGFVGSFTTFSALSVETIELFKDQHIVLGIVYVLISMIGGLWMSRLGLKTVKEAE